jgi:hypothetical protein
MVTSMTTYEIKNLNTLSSGAYTATLYRDNKRIATLEDDGRGGQVRMWATAKDATWRETEVLQVELTAWSKTNLPDWYLTSWGAYDRLDPDWELAVGYLTEAAEINKATKGGRLKIVRKSDGTEWAMNLAGLAALTGTGLHVWTGITWEEVK